MQYKAGKTCCALAFTLIMTILGVSVHAQGYEIGLGIGGFNYIGDLERGLHLKTTRPAATGFVRYNMNDALSFRAAITAGQMVGWDEYYPIDPFAERRDASFDIFVFEASGVLEYHFLEWRQENYPIRWTPYFFGGLAIFGIAGNEDKPEDYSNIQPAIPFGAGVKYILNPKWYIGFELGARKTFFDYLDNVSDGDGVTKDYQYGNKYDNDLYYYGGFSITYSFYTIPCPVSPYQKRYRRK
ncbi:DUF6089 family protein [Fulvivirga sedimenti]|uniref:DUF6089 family protein n=1 Tax=Fulvivirga sedimenti TaxID=2879465 RepID=A0A9X1HP68_9BACT|nr:DUF6089 family protein [Fulvivirga sedimenti]MCA6074423.1 DUF6089 family protein [Fulvivirga sedimenti]